MEELQKLQRAREYLQQLSQGIDPISHEALPEGNGITGQRLRNCFAYVAGVLGQVIENGGQVGRQTREKKAPFSISAQQLSQVELSDTPVSLSVVVQRINEAAGLDDTKKKLTHPPLANWLLTKGFLQEVTDAQGHKSKAATIQAGEIGIVRAQRQNPNGKSYWVNLYTREAQQFLLDHLEQILQEPAGDGEPSA